MDGDRGGAGRRKSVGGSFFFSPFLFFLPLFSSVSEAAVLLLPKAAKNGDRRQRDAFLPFPPFSRLSYGCITVGRALGMPNIEGWI